MEEWEEALPGIRSSIRLESTKREGPRAEDEAVPNKLQLQSRIEGLFEMIWGTQRAERCWSWTTRFCSGNSSRNLGFGARTSRTGSGINFQFWNCLHTQQVRASTSEDGASQIDRASSDLHVTVPLHLTICQSRTRNMHCLPFPCSANFLFLKKII